MRAMKELMNWREKARANSPAKNLPNHVVCSINSPKNLAIYDG